MCHGGKASLSSIDVVFPMACVFMVGYDGEQRINEFLFLL